MTKSNDVEVMMLIMADRGPGGSTIYEIFFSEDKKKTLLIFADHFTCFHW
jgi:hypothetical protein